MKIIKLPFTIATLDIETLALHAPDAAVDEIGLVFTNCLTVDEPFTPDFYYREGKFQEENGLFFHGVTLHPPILEQLMELGSSYDHDTIRFRQKVFKEHYPDSTEPFYAGRAPKSPEPDSVELNWRSFKRLFNEYKPEDLWVNHPEFDLPLIRNLFRKQSLEMPWHYQSVCDISAPKRLHRRWLKLRNSSGLETFNKELAHPGLNAWKKHTGLGDCVYNLWLLAVLAKETDILGAYSSFPVVET